MFKFKILTVISCENIFVEMTRLKYFKTWVYPETVDNRSSWLLHDNITLTTSSWSVSFVVIISCSH